MSTKTNQLGSRAVVERVAALVWALLGDPGGDESPSATLAALGVRAGEVLDLWEAVCVEFGDRTLGAEIDPGELNTSMTLEVAAATMAKLLGQRGGNGG